LLLQLYNEDINDLLAPENLKLPIHESKENGVYVAGLREDIVVSPEQVLELLREGEANRHIGATKMNEGSSRSHTVFRMVRMCTASSSTGCTEGVACLYYCIVLCVLVAAPAEYLTAAASPSSCVT
jgi:hypothetical protein